MLWFSLRASLEESPELVSEIWWGSSNHRAGKDLGIWGSGDLFLCSIKNTTNRLILLRALFGFLIGRGRLAAWTQASPSEKEDYRTNDKESYVETPNRKDTKTPKERKWKANQHLRQTCLLRSFLSLSYFLCLWFFHFRAAMSACLVNMTMLTWVVTWSHGNSNRWRWLSTSKRFTLPLQVQLVTHHGNPRPFKIWLLGSPSGASVPRC